MTAVLSHRIYWHTISHARSSLVVLSLRYFRECLGILRSIDWRNFTLPRAPGVGWQRRKANDGKPPCTSGSPTSIVSASILSYAADKEMNFVRVIVSPTPNRRLLAIYRSAAPQVCISFDRASLEPQSHGQRLSFFRNPGRSPCSWLRQQDRASKRK